MDVSLMELVPLDQADGLPVQAIGGKAARLATLRTRGYSVPDGFILTTAIHEQAMRRDGDRDEHGAPSFPRGLRRAFADACDRLGYPLIVRSSAVAEDLATASFAGQFESVLDVGDADEAISAAERCWSAASSRHLSEYRRAIGTTGGAVALLVQRQIAPTAAGVAFGRDPVTGRDRVVVEAVPGLADRLLDGETSPERWIVADGRAERDASALGAPALRAADALRVAETVRGLGAVFGGPQDVEWAMVGDELDVLQSRPITRVASTTASPSPTRQEVPATWLRDSLHWPDRLSPFGADVWRRAARAGVSAATAEFGLLIASAELHLVDHRVYLEVVPFGPRRLPPPPAWLLPVAIRVVPQIRSRVARAVDAVRTDAAGRVLERWIEHDGPALVAELEVRRAIDLAMMDVDRLGDHLEDTIAFFDRACTEHWVAMFASAQALAEYVFLARDLLGWDDAHAISALDPRSNASTDAAVALDELAELAVGGPVSDDGERAPSVAALLAGDTLASIALRHYLERFGGRMLGCDPMDPTLAEDPESLQWPLEAAIRRVHDRSLVEPTSRNIRSAEASSADPATIEVAADERAGWRRACARAARYYGIRDESELLGFGEPMGLVRGVALELGRRLVSLGLLDRPDDCFMLTPEQLRRAARAGTPVRDLASRRRAEFDAAALIPDAPAVGTLPAPPDLRALPAEARFANEAILWYLGSIVGTPSGPVLDGAIVAGTGASAGRYRGPVRVIRGAQDFDRVRSGDVLVCPTTSPSWSPILGQVGAIVADHGGMLAHPAIIAREFGIPAIVGTADGTSKLRDGELVLVDGTAGTVSR